MRIAIVYASDEGQTARIAAYLVEEFRRHDVLAEGMRFLELPTDWDLHDYDVVIVGASVHSGQYQPHALQWVQENAQKLRRKDNAFYSVSLMQKDVNRSSRAHEIVQGYIKSFVQQTGWKPQKIVSFAGALRYSQYGVLKRWFLRRVIAENGTAVEERNEIEYTDWEAVRQFAADVLYMHRALM